MRIMNGDRAVAKLRMLPGTMYPVVTAEDWTTFIDLPIELFGFDKREVTYEEFLHWAKKRCFPEERVDKDDVLKKLGLKKYDPWEIIKITNAILYGIDEFWVDFDN